MKLKTVYFDAYKSLLDISLDFTHSCMGLVGINESGKSNILRALEKLSIDNNLGPEDIPKMQRDREPQLRFVFELEKQEKNNLQAIVNELGLATDIDIKAFGEGDVSLTYSIRYNKNEKQEERFFSINNVSLPDGYLVLKRNALTNKYKVKVDGQMIPIEQAVLLSEEDLKNNEDIACWSNKLSELAEVKETLEDQINELLPPQQDGQIQSEAVSTDDSEPENGTIDL